MWWNKEGSFVGGILVAAMLAGMASARSLSYRQKASEPKACFYATIDPLVDLRSSLLQVYYAASDAKASEVAYVDVVALGPLGQQLYSQVRQTHAEINIKPPQSGEYSICISHHGAPTDKNLDVDISVPRPPAATADKARDLDTGTAKLESTMQKLQRDLSDLLHTLRYVKSREKRNLETVEAVENWIFAVSIFEVLLIIGMSILQVTVLRMFFSGSRKQRV